MHKNVLVLISLMIWFSAAHAAAPQSSLKLMPWPASVQQRSGEFTIDQAFAVRLEGYQEPRLQLAVQRFLDRLSRQTGMPLANQAVAPAKFIIHCEVASEKVQRLGEDESYRLEVTPAGARLTARNPLGALRGLQTFLQLVQVGPHGFAAPAVTIEDHPRFPWRGLMIDVSRHFLPLEDLERNLDAMEALKFNVLHWHLSDNQGFRIESKKFPKFQQLASDGKFYTQAQIADVIEYARDRGIRVVPEFDMPGHTTSWFAAYPELASAPGPYEIERKWGVFDPAIDPTKKETYRFLDQFIGEMAGLFPDDYFHIGGDEVNGKQWDGNPAIQQFMRARALKNNEALQGYFNRKLEPIVTRHKKKMMGWDEILDPALPKDILIQSWRGQESLAAAARQGYSGLLSNGYYLDLMQPASEHYLVDPMAGAAASLTTAEQKRILGGEACMWSELVTAENIDGRIWPRAAAVAERLWSPADVRDLDSMYSRLAAVDDDLQFLGIKDRSNRRLMLERAAGSEEIHTLQVLVDVVEPVKQYTRTGTDKYTSATPLNRLVDAAHPESDKAREFGALVNQFLKSGDPATAAELHRELEIWRENNDKVEPLLQSSSLLAEDVPLSKDLEMVAAIGIEALDYHNGGAPAGWRDAQLNMLKEAAPPKAELLDMLVPHVQKLVEAVPAQ